MTLSETCKVQTFWEAHKFYEVNVQSMRKIAQIFVWFSESPNFKVKVLREGHKNWGPCRIRNNSKFWEMVYGRLQTETRFPKNRSEFQNINLVIRFELFLLGSLTIVFTLVDILLFYVRTTACQSQMLHHSPHWHCGQ